MHLSPLWHLRVLPAFSLLAGITALTLTVYASGAQRLPASLTVRPIHYCMYKEEVRNMMIALMTLVIIAWGGIAGYAIAKVLK